MNKINICSRASLTKSDFSKIEIENAQHCGRKFSKIFHAFSLREKMTIDFNCGYDLKARLFNKAKEIISSLSSNAKQHSIN